MNLKRLAFWTAIFCCLLAYVMLFEHEDGKRPQAIMPEETYERVFPFEADDIQAVSITDGEKSVRLEREGSDMRVVEPEGAHASADLTGSLLDAITGAVVIDGISSGEELAQYGLDPPAMTLTVWPRGKQEPIELQLGANAPSNINLYARLPQQNRIVLLGTYLRFSLRTFLDNVK